MKFNKYIYINYKIENLKNKFQLYQNQFRFTTMYTVSDSNVFPSYEAELNDWNEYCMHRMLEFTNDVQSYIDSCKEYNRPLPDPVAIQEQLNFLIKSLEKSKPVKSKYQNN